jgi:hypothetical protein
MRNRILKGGVLLALGYLPLLAVGCGGGSDDGGGGLKNKGGSGGSAAGGSSGSGATGGTIPIGGSVGNGGSGAGGSAGSLNGDSACVDDSVTGNRAVAALYFMVDISGSMNCPVPEASPPCEVDPGNDPMPSRWTEASQAYKDFFGSPAASGLWAGISFFSGNSCDPGAYGPEVEIAALPGNASALAAAVDDQDPSGNTPTVPSLSAAIDHARDWAAAHTDQQAVVVYATDGYPRGCSQNNTIDEAVNVAAEGYMGTPRVHTYVLAIGPNLGDLNRVAAAGGTEAAIAINTGMDVGQQLIDALNDIREEVDVDCTYQIPNPPAGQTINYNQVNVRITTAAGEQNVGKDDPSDSTCNGWQYSADMRQIVLCGEACDAIMNDPNPGLSVLFGCETVIEPP